MDDPAALIAEFERVTGQPAAAAPPPPAGALPPPFPGGSAAAMRAIVTPNELAKNNAPTIHLAGLDWPIPLLAPRQNRIVVPAVAKVTKRMRETAEAKLAALDADTTEMLLRTVPAEELARLGRDGALRKQIWAITDFSFEIAATVEPEFFDNISDAVYWALTRAHPQMTRAQFDDMPIGTLELIDAVGIVAQQTGMMKRVDPRESPLATQPAAPNPNPPTSTG